MLEFDKRSRNSVKRKSTKEVEMKSGKILVTLLLSFVFLSTLAMGNGLNLNSLGTRALAMGGAFVGLADDFSAIYWNPAGITHFKTRYFGFFGTDIIPSGTYKFAPKIPQIGTLTLVNAKTATKHFLSGMAAYYHPISPNLVAGIGIYVPSGLGSNWDGADFANISENATYDWNSLISVVTFAPALAYKINDMISVGLALNINYGNFDIKMHAGSTPIPTPPYKLDLGQYEESLSGWGYGATLGVLVKPNEMFSLGATFRTRSTLKFSGEARISRMSLLGFPASSDIKRDVTRGMWIVGGIAYKPMDNLILTGDIQWSEWTTIGVMETDFIDPYWKVIMAASGDDKRPMYWENKAQIRFGAEYQVTKFVALRGGYYWDPSPAPDKTMNVLLPNYDFHVLTVGFGYALNDLQIDVGFEYLMGKERSVPYAVLPLATYPFFKVQPSVGYESAMPGTYKMKIIVPNLSISYKF